MGRCNSLQRFATLLDAERAAADAKTPVTSFAHKTYVMQHFEKELLQGVASVASRHRNQWLVAVVD